MVPLTAEILPNAILQDYGLAHIDYLPAAVLHDVDAGRLRQLLQLFLYQLW